MHEQNWHLEAPRRIVETELQAVGYPTEGYCGSRGDNSVTVQGYDPIATLLTFVSLPFR